LPSQKQLKVVLKEKQTEILFSVMGITVKFLNATKCGLIIIVKICINTFKLIIIYSIKVCLYRTRPRQRTRLGGVGLN